MQFDAAYVPAIAEKKFPESKVKAMPMYLYFQTLIPAISAISYAKGLGDLMHMAPLLQGTAKSVSDLSRGASASDIVVASYISQLRVEKD